jgi:hypothetical protein
MIDMTFDWDEVNSLICLLQVRGVFYLRGTAEAKSGENEIVDPVHLLQRLAGCGYPLVENATISLFLLHPELASAAVQVMQQSTQEIAENLVVVTLATLYLQQWWIFRLTFAFGHLPSFPETPFVALWQERHLPSPDVGYGYSGLLALQEYQQQRYGLPLNFLDDWQNQLDHLLAQEDAYHRELSDDVRQTLVQLC